MGLTSPEYMNCVGSTSRSSLACFSRTCDASTNSESGEVSGIRSTLQFPDLKIEMEVEILIMQGPLLVLGRGGK